MKDFVVADMREIKKIREEYTKHGGNSQ